MFDMNKVWQPEHDERIEEGEILTRAQVVPRVIRELQTGGACDYDDGGCPDHDDDDDTVEMRELLVECRAEVLKRRNQLAAAMSNPGNVLIEPYVSGASCHDVQVSISVNIADEKSPNFRPLHTGLNAGSMDSMSPEEWRNFCLFALRDEATRQRQLLQQDVTVHEEILKLNAKTRESFAHIEGADAETLMRGLRFL